MPVHVSLTMKSKNSKVGPMPASTTSEETCPPTCQFIVKLKKTCYPKVGFFTRLHWDAVSSGLRGDNWGGFCLRVKTFPSGQRWRHNVAGDLYGHRGRLNRRNCLLLARSAKHTRGWTYTHYRGAKNLATVRQMNRIGGFTVNMSADTMSEADMFFSSGLPTVVVLPMDAPHRGNFTPKGVPIVVCPAQTQPDMTCLQCGLCQIGQRKSIVGFLAHAKNAKSISERIESGLSIIEH